LVPLAVLTLSGCPFSVKYSVGGTVTGLSGTGLVLQDNSGSSVTANANGAFTFGTRLTNNAAYTVTVQTQPTNPTQTCSVRNGSGTINKTSVINVIVSCTQPGRFAYVANQTSNTISAYAIDANNGLLTPVTGSPFSSIGTTPAALLVDPNGTFLYVADNTTSTVSVFAIAPITSSIPGALTPQNFSVVTGTSPDAIAIHPAGKFLYVANFGSNSVSAYAVGSGGSLTALTNSPVQAGVGPSSLKVDPNGNYLYVANEGGADVAVFVINATTGALTSISGSPFAAGNSPVSITIDSTAAFAYVANATDHSIAEYAISATTGALTAASGSPLGTTTEPLALAADPLGRNIYATNVTAANQVASYSITPSSGVLAPVSSVAAGLFPVSIAVEPMGQYVYVANQNSNNVTVYTVGSGGALQFVANSSIATGTQPSAIAVD
jgi:6-phosphogluconolactonase (cycloisomerase 2 family)